MKAYPSSVRDAALLISTQVGTNEASRRTGIHAATISLWRRRAGITSEPRRGRTERPPSRYTGEVRADGRKVHRRSHDPADWEPLPNGSWRSPSGMVFRPDSLAVRRVIAARQRAAASSS